MPGFGRKEAAWPKTTARQTLKTNSRVRRRQHRHPRRASLVVGVQKYIPAGYVGLTSLGVSILLGVIAIAATNGFHGYGWGIVLTGVIGVAQAVYTLVNQAFNGKLSKDSEAK
ncbi:hypothetical protein D2E25_1215 [Bifidobacterium goeldii]|uniref:Uncharacterized protein n=2 Tax=Bifidobacterium goeldii TaxID=2306975 RepID=A0A430FKG2_9BIFI|nr:hypothetical protein D2E25_1215 [Bifidobacterium goeldii]